MTEAILAQPKVRAGALAGLPASRFAAADYIVGETVIADGGDWPRAKP